MQHQEEPAWFGDTGAILRLALLVVSLVLLAACQKSPHEKAAYFLRQAQLRAKDGKTNEAILDYRRAIQYEPNSTLPRLELIRLYLSHQDSLAAFGELKLVLKLHPGDREVRTEMADFLLQQGDFSGAKTEAEKLVAEKPDDPKVLFILAQSALGLKDFELVRSTAQHILHLDSKDSQGWYALGIVQLAAGQRKQSEESFRKAIENKPDWIEPTQILAALLTQEKAFGDAERLIRQAVAANPDSVRPYYLLAAFLMQQRRSSEAEAVLRRIKLLGQRDPGDRGALARYYVVTKNLDAASAEYSEIVKRHPEDALNRRQLGLLEVSQGHIPRAEQILEDGLKINPDDPETLLLRGQLRVYEGQLEKGIDDIQRASRLRPKWGLPQYFLGLAQLRAGKQTLGENALNNALQLQPDLLAARLVLSQLALRRGDAGRALNDLDETLKKRPPVVEPYLLHAVALAQQGQQARAAQDLLPLLDEFPQTPARALTYRTLAWVKFTQKRYDEAHDLAKRALEDDPNSGDALYLLGISRVAAKKTDTGLAEVEAETRANPHSAQGYEALGQIYLTANRYADAERVLREAVRLNPKLGPASLNLSYAEVQQGKLDQAKEVLSNLTANQPQFAEAYARIGRICESQADWKGASINYQKALDLSPDDVVAKNNLAWVYAEHGGNIDVALRLAQEAKEAQPDNANISDTLGWIFVRKQSYGNAIELLRDSVRREPRKALYEYHLGVAYLRAEQKGQAKQALEAALRMQPDFPGAEDAKRILNELPK